MRDALALARFWGRVCMRALKDACAYLGHDRKRPIIGVVGLLVAALASWWVAGGAAAICKVESWFYGLGSPLLLLIVFWLCFVVRTPWLLEREAEERGGRRAVELQTQIDALQFEVAKHAADIARLNADVERAKTSDPARSALRHHVNEFLAKLEGLEARMVSGDDSALMAFGPLDQEVDRYLKENLRTFPWHVVSGRLLRPWEAAKEENRADVLHRCRDAVKLLKQLVLLIK